MFIFFSSALQLKNGIGTKEKNLNPIIGRSQNTELVACKTSEFSPVLLLITLLFQSMPGLPIFKTLFDISHQGKPEKVQYSYSHATSRNHYLLFSLALEEMAAIQITLAIT